MTRQTLFLGIIIGFTACSQPDKLPCVHEDVVYETAPSEQIVPVDSNYQRVDTMKSNLDDQKTRANAGSEFVQFQAYPDNRIYWVNHSVGREYAYMYSNDSSKTKKIDSLSQGAQVLLIDQRNLVFGLEESKLLQVQHAGKTGYIEIEDLDFYRFSHYSGGEKTYLSVGIENYGGNQQTHLRIQSTGAIDSKLVIEDGSHDYHPRLLQVPALRNVEFMMYINHARRYSCPGVNNEQFIVLTDKGLDTLISTWSTGEAGYHSLEKVYIPMKFRNGKTLLVHDGDVERIFNSHTAELDTMTYHEKFGVPVEDLVLIYRESAEPVIDADGNEVINAYSENELRITGQDTLFYRWDGQKLNLIK